MPVDRLNNICDQRENSPGAVDCKWGWGCGRTSWRTRGRNRGPRWVCPVWWRAGRSRSRLVRSLPTVPPSLLSRTYRRIRRPYLHRKQNFAIQSIASKINQVPIHYDTCRLGDAAKEERRYQNKNFFLLINQRPPILCMHNCLYMLQVFWPYGSREYCLTFMQYIIKYVFLWGGLRFELGHRFYFSLFVTP